MAITTPRIDQSETINEISANISRINRQLQQHLFAITDADTKLREEIGLVQDIALERLKTLEELAESGLRDCDFRNANKDLEGRIKQIRDDYIANYRTILKERGAIMNKGQEVAITRENRDSLLQGFVARLDQSLQPHFENRFNRYETDVRHEIRVYKEEIADRDAEIMRIFDERTRHTTKLIAPTATLGKLLEEKEAFQRQQDPRDIYMASQVGDLQAIKRFLPFAFKTRAVNKKDDRGFTPLQIAAYCNQIPTVGFLLGEGASVKDVDSESGYQAHHWAAWIGNVHVLHMLLQQKGVDIDARGAFGRTPLHVAAFKHKLNAVQYLLKQGADINAQTDRDGGREAPLHQSVTNGDEAMVRLLCNFRHLDPNLRTDRNFSPLYMATDLVLKAKGRKRFIA